MKKNYHRLTDKNKFHFFKQKYRFYFLINFLNDKLRYLKKAAYE